MKTKKTEYKTWGERAKYLSGLYPMKAVMYGVVAEMLGEDLTPSADFIPKDCRAPLIKRKKKTT